MKRTFDIVGTLIDVTKTTLKHPLWLLYTPNKLLESAVSDGNTSLVRYAISRGAQIEECRNYFDERLLHFVVSRSSKNRLELTLALIEGGANINAIDNQGKTPLHAAVKRQNNIEIVHALIEAGADVNAKSESIGTPLAVATFFHQAETTRVLVEAGANITEVKITEKGTLLHKFSYCDKTVSALIKAGVDVNAKNNKGETPLHSVAQTGCSHPDCSTSARILIDAGANIETKDNNGKTPLHCAARNLRFPIVRALIKAGANLKAIDNKDMTPLHHAASGVSLETVRALIEAGADINAIDNNGETALHHNALWGGDVEIGLALIEAGANIKAIDNNGKTPLHNAAASGRNHEIMRALIEAGSDIDIKDYDGETPLHHAAKRGVPKTVRTLIEAGANKFSLNNNDATPLTLALDSHCCRIETVTYLLSLPEFQPITRFGAELASNNNALLLRAVETNYLAMVNDLLGCDEVIANITVDDNAIIRLAISYRHTAIEARLRQVPALSNYRPTAATARGRPERPERTLAEIAAYSESAMAALTRGEQAQLDLLRDKYLADVHQISKDSWVYFIRAMFFDTDKVTPALLSLEHYLANKYNESPAMDDNNQPLPLQYNEHSPSQEAYYKHAVHTAWRYLQYLKQPYNISITEKETLACTWLAVQQEKCDLDTFIRELAFLGRAHNWDGYRFNPVKQKQEQFDDMKPDNRSCAGGIQKRLLTPIQLLPSMQNFHLLDTTTFKARFKEQLISDNKNVPFNLYHSLAKCHIVELENIKNAIATTFVLDEGEELSVDEQKGLSLLQCSQEQMNGFLQDCKNYFTPLWEEELKAQYAVEITNSQGTVRYDNYPAYATALASNIPLHFGDEINSMLEAIILDKNTVLSAKNYIPSQGAKHARPSEKQRARKKAKSRR